MKSVWFLLLLLVVAIAFWRLATETKPPDSQPTSSSIKAIPEPKTTTPISAVPASVPITSPAQVEAVITPAQPGTFKRIEAPPPPPVKIPGGYAATDQPNPARDEAEEVALNIRNYSLRFGGNPVGTNAEIVKSLTGGNEARATYLPQQLQRLNGAGELLDSWGTPYFFHANSATEMEVRSAGPDRTLHTPDDLTAR